MCDVENLFLLFLYQGDEATVAKMVSQIPIIGNQNKHTGNKTRKNTDLKHGNKGLDLIGSINGQTNQELIENSCIQSSNTPVTR